MPRAPIRHGALQDLKWFHSTVREVDGDRLLIHFMVGRARRTACRASSSAYERGVRHCAGLGRTVGRQHGALEREYPGQLARARIRSGCKRFTCATSILYYHASYCGPLLVQPLFSKTKNWRSNARVRGVCECARA